MLGEKTMEDPTNEQVRRHYGPLKALCEAEAEKAFPGRTTNIRPGLIVGPHDPTERFTYWPRRIAAGGEVLAPGEPDRPIQWIDARDLAAWTIRMVDQGSVGVFNAVVPLSEHVCTFRRLYLAADLRGADWGRRLMQWALDWASTAGFQRVEFWSDTRFTRAHQFFEKLGFQRDGRTRQMDDGHMPYAEHFFYREL